MYKRPGCSYQISFLSHAKIICSLYVDNIFTILWAGIGYMNFACLGCMSLQSFVLQDNCLIKQKIYPNKPLNDISYNFVNIHYLKQLYSYRLINCNFIVLIRLNVLIY